MPVQDLCWKESVVGHRIHLTQINMEECWRTDNSVDCASRGLLSTELLENELRWLHLSDTAWPKLFPTFPLKKMRSVFTMSSLKLIHCLGWPILLFHPTEEGHCVVDQFCSPLPGSQERINMYLKPSRCRRIPLWPWNWISEDKVGISRSNPLSPFLDGDGLFPRAEFQASLW